jgi:hypothetical protein
MTAMIGLMGAALATHGLLGWILAIAAACAVVAGLNVATSGLTGFTAGRTYTASAAAMGKGLAVVRVTDDNHVAIAGANVAILGFVDESNINIGDAINIIEAGEFYGQIGAAVTAGNFLITDASGRLIPTAAAGDNVVAMALTSGTSANDFIVAIVNQFVRGAQVPEVDYVASGALAVQSSLDTLGSSGALAMTLATPTSGQGGISKKIVAITAHAHTVTAAPNKIQDANATYDTVTFAHVGDFIELESIGTSGVWQVVALRGATLSEV